MTENTEQTPNKEIWEELELRMNHTPDFKKISESERQLVFVYGTLKRDHGNHGIYLNKAEYLGEGRTLTENFTMRQRSIGSFPVLFENHENALDFQRGSVKGEIFAVTPYELAALDRLEGNPWFYERKEKYVKFMDQDVVENDKSKVHRPIQRCWMYITNPDLWDDATGGFCVKRLYDNIMCFEYSRIYAKRG